MLTSETLSDSLSELTVETNGGTVSVVFNSVVDVDFSFMFGKGPINVTRFSLVLRIEGPSFSPESKSHCNNDSL